MWNEIFKYECLEKNNNKSPDKNDQRLDNWQFSLKLFYTDNIKRKGIMIGQESVFFMNELHGQKIYEKLVNFKDLSGDKLYAQVGIRCQLINNFEDLLKYWKNEIEAKLALVKGILNRTSEYEKMEEEWSFKYNTKKRFSENARTILENKPSGELDDGVRFSSPDNRRKKILTGFDKSLVSIESSIEMNQSTVYDNQFYIK
jgi:hypothetical protein